MVMLSTNIPGPVTSQPELSTSRDKLSRSLFKVHRVPGGDAAYLRSPGSPGVKRRKQRNNNQRTHSSTNSCSSHSTVPPGPKPTPAITPCQPATARATRALPGLQLNCQCFRKPAPAVPAEPSLQGQASFSVQAAVIQQTWAISQHREQTQNETR